MRLMKLYTGVVMSNNELVTRMTPKERINEIAKILADGFLRLHSKSNNTKDCRDYSVDLPAHPSIHARNKNS